MKIAVIGIGAIGRAWTISFMRAGHDVRIWNQSPGRIEEARDLITKILPDLEAADLLNGRTPDQVMQNFHPCETLEEAVDGVDYVQENTAENVEVKKEIFARIEAAAPEDAIIASSTSGIVPSAFTGELKRPERCLVAHPLNPPYLVPAVDLVPSPKTSKEVMQRTAGIMKECGQVPILMEKEDPGFITIRLQGMMYHECWRLVNEGLADPESIDVAVREGLGLRWSFIGPFETADLNAPGGIRDFVGRFGDDLNAIHPRVTDPVRWEGKLLDQVEEARREKLPMDSHKDRQLWRDRRLIALAAHKAERTRNEG
ncbi:3-hydroxyacyl-CoA dehydrogenase [Histidinibacterium aquaticum]|uniref:3-hydroxyacyl-CoA dehydrogenase n=1 Tax=Histidinibacterium aquaticum TaxID=2613962 RepID=A0A5J5GJ16_9RHOB|nr:3-hydroxyacyl-CoA dehydrogenase [Histidinibacterium aquaticum]KAA9008117.1 3-hydroxyacyl-CoA dehydrogenase [Histidinibacterium aquaticum]